MFNWKLKSFNLTLIGFALLGCSTGDYDHSNNEFSKGEAKPVEFWWPNRLNLKPLRQHSLDSNPYGRWFKYSKEFKKLNLKAVKRDIRKVLKDSQPWWPADYGHYGPFFIRMAWHSAGTYRVSDGRGGAAGGQLRFEPLNSWPDNTNLDKARRLLWPVKKKYGRKISWADLMVLTGNVALEDMGFKTLGFAGGRMDDWEPDEVYWGPEKKFLDSKRHAKGRKLNKRLGATRMGLIYVNPEGPNGDPDPLKAAQDIRVNFARMAMNDEETAALIAGGHTFGKAHGAHKPEKCLSQEPAGAPLEQQGFGWKNKCGKGHSEDTITSGLEGAWSANPIAWSSQYIDNLYDFEWVKTKSPAGATQWIPANGEGKDLVPDAHLKDKRHAPIMFTTDLALKEDPSYRKITMEWRDDMGKFEKAFARAWFKLTHRDMGPRARYLGSEVPKEIMLWQDPVPRRNYSLIGESEIQTLKGKIMNSGVSIPDLIETAWASAASFRMTDMRGGANGARLRLAPQNSWKVNNPEQLKRVLAKLTKVQRDFNKQLGDNKKVSLADVIVLGGSTAVEEAARKAGYPVIVKFTPGRTDASQKQTDSTSFSHLDPKADAFRNYYSDDAYMNPLNMLVDKSLMLNLSVPEMTVLIGGMRVLNTNADGSKNGVFTKRPGLLTNDFFVNLLDMKTIWKKSESQTGIYEGYDRKTNKLVWTGTPVDLIFGSHSELRSIAEVYASNDARRKFVNDFARAWSKVMNLDRF